MSVEWVLRGEGENSPETIHTLAWVRYDEKIPECLLEIAKCAQQNQVPEYLFHRCSDFTKQKVGQFPIKFQVEMLDLWQSPHTLLNFHSYTNQHMDVILITMLVNISHPDFTQLKCIPEFLRACKGKLSCLINETGLRLRDVFEKLQTPSYIARRIEPEDLLLVDKIESLHLQEIDSISKFLLANQKFQVNELKLNIPPEEKIPRMFFPEMIFASREKPNGFLLEKEYQRIVSYGINGEGYIYVLPQVFANVIATGLFERVPFLVEDLYDPRLLIQIWWFTDDFTLVSKPKN